ncbi:hypothetical protein OESDEN_05800 [Oesophagostomum dentatum]|uniref:Serine/threonine specific protein phosphatases domain-containing protein n=1 Tax=Oesophagostomum dentatum TaxID=61180 RepID=A0A0B1TEN4_OESDE|nr:hypothetical protein OESDEN_05800 [Oesophagostomum dentatum]
MNSYSVRSSLQPLQCLSTITTVRGNHEDPIQPPPNRLN